MKLKKDLMHKNLRNKYLDHELPENKKEMNDAHTLLNKNTAK